MTKDEFNEWLTYHGSRFLGIGPWLTKANGHGGMPDRQDVLQAWAHVLRDVSLENAKRGTDDLYCLPDEKQPRSFDRHPVVVRELATGRQRNAGHRAWSPKMRDGIEVFDCLSCRDTGAVTVVDPRSIREVQKGNGPAMVDRPVQHPLYTAAVGCTCKHSAGQGWTTKFEEGVFLATPDDWGRMELDEKMSIIQEWLETRKPAGFHDEFEQYSRA